MHTTGHDALTKATSRRTALAVAVLLIAALAAPALAQDTTWQADPATPASWTNPDNWTAGAPQSDSVATIDNGGTAVIAGPSAQAARLIIDSDSTVQQDGGTMSLLGPVSWPDATLSVNDGFYRLNAGALVLNSPVYVGGPGDYLGVYKGSGHGTVYQDAGNVSAANKAIFLGYSEGSRGDWTLAGSGTLTCGELRVGYYGTGFFTQSGGAVTVATNMVLADGRLQQRSGYTLTQGTLQVGTMKLGYRGIAEMVQTGGTCTVTELMAGYLDGGDGTYSLSGDGVLQVTNEYLGYQGDGIGVFNQTGGTHVVTNSFQIGTNFPTTVGRYNLESGSLTTRYIDVGHSGGIGIFTQSGGTHTVTDTLTLGSVSSSRTLCHGTYTITGGTLSAKTIVVAEVPNHNVDTGGTIEILDPAADVRVSRKIHFGPSAALNTVPGARISLPGDVNFDIASVNPQAMSGLSDLTVLIDSGPGNLAGKIEVASEDRGAVMAGFDDNFAFGTIHVGPNLVSTMRLVDRYDSHPSSPDLEALYVRTLILEPGSTIDLNARNLYCLNFIDKGGTIELNYGTLQVVPEPATLSLVGLGLAALVARRRRR